MNSFRLFGQSLLRAMVPLTAFATSTVFAADDYITVRADVLNTTANGSGQACTTCHAGSGTCGAPTIMNNYATAAPNALNMHTRTVSGSMPLDPADCLDTTNINPSSLSALLAWANAGAPERPATANTHTTVQGSNPTLVTGATTATLKGTVDTNVYSGTSVQGTYFFKYGTTTSYSLGPTPSENRSSTSSAVVMADVTNLTCETLYHYTAVATNGSSTSADDDETFTAGSCAAPIIRYNSSTAGISQNYTVAKGSSMNNAADFLLDATDVDGTAGITWTKIGDPAVGTASVSGSGATPTVTYTAPANVPMPDTVSFQVRATDSSAGGARTDTITVNIQIVDNPPVITNASQPETINVNEDDLDGESVTLTAMDADGDMLTWSLVGGTGPATGTLSNSFGTGNSQVVTYIPDPESDIDDSFTVRVSDGAGSADIVVNAVVTPLPDDPVANDDLNFEVLVNSTNNILDVLPNDTDVDTIDTKQIISIGMTSNGGSATISAATINNTISYTPVAAATIAESFTYTMEDSFGRQATANVTVSPPDTDMDGVPDYIDNCAATPNGAAEDNQADNDNDQIINVNTTTDPADPLVGGDACDTDDDNDGMSDVDEAMFPACLDPNVDDALGDCDGDGVNNITEVNDGDPNTRPDQDSVAPSVTAPANITVDATGFLTVVDLGTPVAIDGNDGNITIITPVLNATITDSPADNADCLELSDHPNPAAPFRPGAYTVNWYTCDSAGNLSTPAAQTVNVRPIATTTSGQVIGEGLIATVDVMLNGDAPAYPVTLGYATTGDALNPQDHDAVGGPIIISDPDVDGNSPGRVGRLQVNIAVDAVAEPQEQLAIVLTSADQAVLGMQKTHTISIVENNIAPEVEIDVVQNALDTGATIYADGGNVVLTADSYDANGNLLFYQWSDASSAITGIATGATTSMLSFDPVGLTAGVYPVSVTANDGAATTTANINLVVVATAPAAAATANDDDNDGLLNNDPLEGAGDDDGDGIPNYLDDISLPETVLQNQTADPNSSLLLETEAGLLIAMGTTAQAAGVNAGQVSQSDIDSNGGQAGGVAVNSGDTYTNVGGFYDFEISGLNTSKDTADVVIPLPVGILPDSEYRKYRATANGGAWSSFVIDDFNKVKTAKGSLGVCPAPGSAEYSDGLTAFDFCVQLTLQDGGPNDADGLRDFVIRDPGGVATPPATPAAAPSADGRIGVLHPLLVVLLVSVPVLIYGRRRLRQH